MVTKHQKFTTYSATSSGPIVMRLGDVTSFLDVSFEGAREWPCCGGFGSSIGYLLS